MSTYKMSSLAVYAKLISKTLLIELGFVRATVGRHPDII